MSLTPQSPFLADQPYMGDPMLVGRTHLVPRPHLVAPQPQPATVRRELQDQVTLLLDRVADLEARVLHLERPGWWALQRQAARTRWAQLVDWIRTRRWS